MGTHNKNIQTAKLEGEKHRFRMTLAYKGTAFAGFQVQPGLDTVQSKVEAALFQILGEHTRAVPSGRTDRGVHAQSQTVHFDIATPKALQRAARRDFAFRLNAVLPSPIACLSVTPANGFHARNQARLKTYVYLILLSRCKNPFLEDFVWRLPGLLNVPAMRAAARVLIGRHDFTSFCASDSTTKSKRRRLVSIRFSAAKPAPFLALPGERYLRLTFTGEGFLKQMVRNLVATLVAVGRGTLKPAEIKRILTARDRTQAPFTAPAAGLFLHTVRY